MECKIEFLDNPKEFYEPSQKIKAQVTLVASKTEKINRINCEILGYAKCKWYEDRGNQRVDVNRARQSYINESFCLRGEFENNQVELTAGTHNFDVSYALSAQLPTSFKCKNGSIKYLIRITVDRSWKMNSTFDFPFIIIRPLNLNSDGGFSRNPMKDEISKIFKMDFTSEPLYLSASIPFCGFVPGQTIPVKIEVNNQSKTHVKEIKVSLKKIVSLCSQKPKKKVKEMILSEAKVSTEAVPILTMKTFEEKLAVPSLPPNILNCDVIQVQYELRVKAKTSGLNRSPKLKLPITIGTIPLEVRGIPQTFSSSSLLPPSYDDVFGNAAGGDSSDGESNFNPRYPVFQFDGEIEASSSTART